MRRRVEAVGYGLSIGLVIAFVIVTRHWPMIQDAAFMHYVVFLMHHGKEPYRDIVEMNFPGSYLLEAAVMEVLGPGSAGWRLYDFALLILCSASLIVLLRPHGRLAGVSSAALFILVHGRDGALMTGERDLAATAFLLCATALVFTSVRRKCSSRSDYGLVFLAGMFACEALTIKPTLLPLAVFLLVWTMARSRRLGADTGILFGAAAVGSSIPLASVSIFMARHNAMLAFWQELHGLIPYHASINPVGLSYLLSHSIAPLLPLLMIWLFALVFLRHDTSDVERNALLFCALCGLLSFLVQRKAFWYQRYPLLAFLIPVLMIDFTRLFRGRSLARFVGGAGLAAAFLLAAGSLLHLARYDSREPPRPLLDDLAAIGTPESLSGHVQCMDTIGPCIDTLYHARIVQSTGFLYDCYLLDGSNPTALDLRRRFWQQMALEPPKVIVVTDSICYNKRSFDKFGRWPEFQDYLDRNYTMTRESGPQPPARYWSHPMEAFQYRVFLRR